MGFKGEHIGSGSKETGENSFTSGSSEVVPPRGQVVSPDKVVGTTPLTPGKRVVSPMTMGHPHTIAHEVPPPDVDRTIPSTKSESEGVPTTGAEAAVAGHARHPVILDADILASMHPTDRLILEMDARGVPASEIGPGIGKSANGVQWKLKSAKAAYRRALNGS